MPSLLMPPLLCSCMQTAVIEALAPRFHHIHMRVGYDHGPQVPDPRADKWLPYTEGHERWWDAIQAAARERGAEEVTVTTEFGPPSYQVKGNGAGNRDTGSS